MKHFIAELKLNWHWLTTFHRIYRARFWDPKTFKLIGISIGCAECDFPEWTKEIK